MKIKYYLINICCNIMYYNNRAMKERIKNKLKDSKKISQSKPEIGNNKTKDEDKKDEDEKDENAEIDEYYFGKDRDEERKKKAYVIFYYTDLRYT